MFVVRPPTATPTGRYLGCVHLQRLLREPPAALVSGIVDTDLPSLSPEDSLAAVTRYFAAYNWSAGRWSTTRTTCWVRYPWTTYSTIAARRLARAFRRTRAQLSRRRAMSESSARQRLDTPRTSRRFSFNFDVEAVGRFSESIARFLGTGRYLAVQTVLVIVWICLNLFAVKMRWDPYPFILLNLAFSTQAAYAAPLILLAQNRQENRTGCPWKKTGVAPRRPRPTPSTWPANSPRCAWPSVRSPPVTTCVANSRNCARC